MDCIPLTTSKLTSTKPPRKLTPIERARIPGNISTLKGSVSSNNVVRGSRVGQFYHNLGSNNRDIVFRTSNFAVSDVSNSSDTSSTIAALWYLFLPIFLFNDMNQFT